MFLMKAFLNQTT